MDAKAPLAHPVGMKHRCLGEAVVAVAQQGQEDANAVASSLAHSIPALSGSRSSEAIESPMHLAAPLSFRVLRVRCYPAFMPRATRNIATATVPAVPTDGHDVEREALDVLADLEDDAFVEVQIKEPRKTAALFPVGFLRRYLEAQEVPGRHVLVFDSDEEVSSQVAADMLGVSRPHLNELLEVEAIPYRRVGNQRRIRVVDLHEFRQRRDRSAKGLGEMAEVVEGSAGGWTR